MTMEIIVAALVALLGLVGAVHKMFISPINDLTVNLARLNSNLERINGDQVKLEIRVSEYEKMIDDLNIRLARNNIV